MTAVSVKTETSVPTSTAPEACSTHVSYCCANTNTLRAGGSAAINIAVLIQLCSNGPNKESNKKTKTGCKRSLTATRGGTSHGIFFIGRSATVTPSVNSAQGAAAFCKNCSNRSTASGG